MTDTATREFRIRRFLERVRLEADAEFAKSLPDHGDGSPAKCGRCGCEELEHNNKPCVVEGRCGRRRERHVYTCPVCGWWCWRRKREGER